MTINNSIPPRPRNSKLSVAKSKEPPQKEPQKQQKEPQKQHRTVKDDQHRIVKDDQDREQKCPICGRNLLLPVVRSLALVDKNQHQTTQHH